MALGVGGPIVDLKGYAISRAFRVLTTRTNRLEAFCKGCGLRMSKGEGREVSVEGVFPAQRVHRYFCSDCFEVIWAANRKYPTRTAEELDALEDGEPREDAPPKSEHEIEQLIREREAGREREDNKNNGKQGKR